MWRVQTEGYKDGTGYPAGTVTWSYLATTPDCEFIASGENQKQPGAVAIGRQGNFMHWGFSASPAHMTDEAQRTFINAIHYIARFDGQRPVAKKIEKLVTRPLMDELMWVISDDGFSAFQSAFKGHSESKTGRDQLLARFVPDTVRERFGDDWPAYISYYRANRSFLFPSGSGGDGWQKLVVDQDAKSLGISNANVAILEKCISLWESGQNTALAKRVLRRYTNESFETVGEWKAWIKSHRDVLFFSEDSGFKFLNFSTHHHANDRLRSRNKSQAAPVRWMASVEPTENGYHRLIITADVKNGWHIYSNVADDSSYSPTTLKIVTRAGLRSVGELIKPAPFDHPLEKGTSIYKGKVNFTQIVKIEPDLLKKLEIRISYQACNDIRCLPPSLVKLKIDVSKSP